MSSVRRSLPPGPSRQCRRRATSSATERSRHGRFPPSHLWDAQRNDLGRVRTWVRTRIRTWIRDECATNALRTLPTARLACSMPTPFADVAAAAVDPRPPPASNARSPEWAWPWPRSPTRVASARRAGGNGRAWNAELLPVVGSFDPCVWGPRARRRCRPLVSWTPRPTGCCCRSPSRSGCPRGCASACRSPTRVAHCTWSVGSPAWNAATTSTLTSASRSAPRSVPPSTPLILLIPLILPTRGGRPECRPGGRASATM